MTDDATLVDDLPSPRLVVRVHGRVTQEVALRAEVTIGRAEDNDLRLMDPRASRHHARVSKDGLDFVLSDLGSANGTLLDGVRLAGPHRLKHGECIKIGETEIAYEEPSGSFEDTLAGPAAATVPPKPSEKAGGRRGLVIGIILAAVAGILIIGAVLLFVVLPKLQEGGEPTLVATHAPQGQVVTRATATPTPDEVPTERPLSTETPPAPVGTLVAPGADRPESSIDQELDQARALTRAGEFSEAIAIYQDLVERAPGDARPEAGWAWTLVLDDEPEMALTHAQQAAMFDPDSAGAAAILARAYIEMGEVENALAVAQQAVGLDASSARAQAVLAEAYLHSDQPQKAVDAADLALVLDSNDAEARRIRGWLYQEVDGDMGRAVGELQGAAGLEPDLWLRRHELGLLLLEAENYSTSILAFQDALQLRPKAATYSGIGEAYYRLDQYDQARASVRQALSAGAGDASTYGLLAASNAQLGRCDEAKTSYEHALETEPDEPLALEAKEVCEGDAPAASPAPSASSTPSATTTSSPSAEASPEPSPEPATPSAGPAAAVSGRIAFPVWNHEAGQYDTYVAKVDGSERQLVVDGMHQPAFSPDGEWLAVKGEKANHQNLFIVRPNGTELKKFTDFREDKLPSWSPDNNDVVLATTRDQPGRPKRVYVIEDVVTKVRSQLGRLLVAGDKPAQGGYATWMPDWRIVYQGCDYTVEPQKCGLFTIPAGGGGAWTQVTDNGVDTAPDAHGNRIAFMSTRHGNWEIYIVNDDGTGLKRLTSNSAHDGLPTWSPDGKTIAFASNAGGAWAVWAMSPDGGNRRKLFDMGQGGLALEWQDERISWGP